MGKISVLLVVVGALLVSVAASPQRRFPDRFFRTTTACPITLESNPLCGTDNRDYPNMSALRCAQRERLGVQFRHFGRCNRFSQRGNTLQRVPQPGNARFQPQRSPFFQPAPPPPPPQQPQQASFFQPQQPAEVSQPQQQPAEVAQPQPAAPLFQAEQAPQQPAEVVQPQGVPFFLLPQAPQLATPPPTFDVQQPPVAADVVQQPQ